MPGLAQVPGVAAAERASASSRASAASGVVSCWAWDVMGIAIVANSPASSKLARTAMRRPTKPMLMDIPRHADFNNVHIGKRVRPVAKNGAAFFGREDAGGQEFQLQIGNIHQKRLHNT